MDIFIKIFSLFLLINIYWSDMEYVIVILLGFGLGSIPTAYILLQKFHGKDITSEGSGNVGALNSMQVSGSKLTGLAVLIIDALKGAVPVLIVGVLYGASFELKMLALIAAVIGHNYSPWIGFKGGRGLATAAGGAVVVSISLFAVWVVIWLIAMAFRRNVAYANFGATLVAILLSFSSAESLNSWNNPPAENPVVFSVMAAVMLLIIMLRLIGPVKEYFGDKRNTIRDK
jgi:glycerol-3-phosphate acyltransferase PlsY